MEQSLLDAVQKIGEVKRFSTQVNDLIAKETKIVLITNSGISYCKPSDGSVLNSVSWFDVTKMHMTEDTLQFDFNNGNFFFETEKVNEIYEVLGDILPRILRPTELMTLGYFTVPEERAPPTPNSVLLRLFERTKAKNIRMSPATFKTFGDLITYANERVDLSVFKNQSEALPLFFDILPLCPQILSIKVKGDDRNIDAYDLLSSAVCESGFLEHIEIDSPITKHFDGFLRHLLKNNDLPINGLSFANSKMNGTNLRSLSKCLSDRYICSVGFHNAILPEFMSSFYNSFLSVMKSKLTVLNLDGTPNLDISSVLTDLPVLEILSLENCSLEINNVLSEFSGKDFPSLKGLNVSNNKCVLPTKKALRLPPSLTTILAHDVTWGDNRMIEFFKSASYGFKSGFRLDISNAKASNDEWQRLFNEIRNMTISGFQSIVWDNNPLSTRFLAFLKKNIQIEYLSISGCIDENDSELLKHVCQYLLQSNVKSLVIKGTKEKRIGALLPSLLETLSNSLTIEYLDLTNSYSHDQGISALSKLVDSDMPLRFLNCDGCAPRDPRFLFEFLYKMAGNKKGAAISFPINDLVCLLNNGRINENHMNWAMDLYRLPQPTINEQPTSFEEPFEIYIEHEQPKFPDYLRPLGPSPDGIKTEDMANTNMLSEERTELTLSIDGDNVKLVPLPKEPRKVSKSDYPPNNTNDGVDTMDLKTSDEPKIARTHKRKEALPPPPEEIIKAPKRLLISESSAEERIDKKSIETTTTTATTTTTTTATSTQYDSSVQDPNKDSQQKKRKKRIKKSSSAKHSTTVQQEEPAPKEQVAVEAPQKPQEEEKRKSSDAVEPPKKRRRKKVRTVSKIEGSEHIWDFPIEFNYDETKRKIFIFADKKNDINALIDLIPKM